MGVRTEPLNRTVASAASAASARMMLPLRMFHPLSFVLSLPLVRGAVMREIEGREAVRQTPRLRPWGNRPTVRRQSGSGFGGCG
jgi:hypothetical protein